MKKFFKVFFLFFTFTVCINSASINIISDPNFKNILADQNGKPLYFFSNDNKPNFSACLNKCLKDWSVFYDENLSFSPALNENDFGTIIRSDGSKQNTYKGWPLYYYKNDIKKGDINGDGIKNVWFVAKPDYSVMIINNNLKGLDNNFYDKQYKKISSPDDSNKVMYLTDSYGVTLYIFTKDEEYKNNYTKSDNKNDIWPVYETGENRIIPSTLDKNDFRVTAAPNGKKQLTFKGHPLYNFKNDDNLKGNTKGVSFPSTGIWPVSAIDIDGSLHKVK